MPEVYAADPYAICKNVSGSLEAGGVGVKGAQIRDSTDIDHKLMDICRIYTDGLELNRHWCRSI